MTIRQKWRVIRRLFAISVANTVAYRFEFVLYMFGSIITPVIGLAIWRATSASGADLPVSSAYLTTYFVLSSLFALATSSWHEMWIPGIIRDGELSVWLMRPGSVFFEVFANNLAEKVIKLLLLLPMVAVFGWFFRDDLVIPSDLLRWIGAGISLVMGAVMFFALRSLMGTVAFWWEETNSVRMAILLVEGILLGGIIPLALFPEWSQGFIAAQPFRYRFAFALDVLLRDQGAKDIAQGFAWQFLWTASFVIAAIWLWDRGRRSYLAVGG